MRGQQNLRRAKGPWAYVVPKGWRGRSGHAVRPTGTNRVRSQQERRVRQTAEVGRAHLTVGHVGLKPSWGKPAVRNFRGARGNGARGSVSRARSRKRRIQPNARLQPLRLGSTRRIAGVAGWGRGSDRGERRGPRTHLDGFWNGWVEGFGGAYADFRRRMGSRRSESRNDVSKRGAVMACPGRARGGGMAERCSGVLPK